jgi:hypothetical protein
LLHCLDGQSQTKERLLTPRAESSLCTKELSGPLFLGRSVVGFMDISKILIWNVQGLDRKAGHDVVRCMIASTRSNVVCLHKTIKEAISHWMVMTTLGAEFDEFTFLPAAGMRGGILMAYKSSVCKVITTRVDAFSVLVQFEQQEGSPWWFAGVYGPQSNELKIQFLQELRTIRSACTGPWVVGGVFNLIYRVQDKSNSNVNHAMMGRFRHLLNDIELSEVHLMGR